MWCDGDERNIFHASLAYQTLLFAVHAVSLRPGDFALQTFFESLNARLVTKGRRLYPRGFPIRNLF